jgi:hypothetical protein
MDVADEREEAPQLKSLNDLTDSHTRMDIVSVLAYMLECSPDALEDLETSLSKHFINPRVLRAARGKDDAQKYINDLDKDLGKKEFWTPVRRFLHQFLEGMGLCHASLSLVVPTKYSFAIVSSLSAIVCWVVPRDTLLERE